MFDKDLTRIVFILIIGFGFLLTGTITTFFWKDIWRYLNRKVLQISPTMMFYKEFENTPLHILNKIYIFNWTNPEEFGTNGTKPILTEVGPYVFREYQNKENITWHTNHTVSYRYRRKWIFDRESSSGALEDTITTINLVPVVTADYSRFWNSYLQSAVSFVLTVIKEGVSTKMDINALTFEGYRYTLGFVGPLFFPKYKKIGYFHLFNDSTLRDSWTNIDTGEKDIQEIGKVKNWDYSKNRRGACGTISGSNGEQYTPELKKERFTIFSAWLCRDFYLDYEGEEVVNGVTGYRYILGSINLDNGTKNHQNACSWPEISDVLSGVVNISACYEDVALIASYPHFYLADPFYASHVVGMNPDAKKHKSSIVIEPITGVPLRAKLAAQANFLINNSSRIRLRVLQNVPTTFFPMFWVEKSFFLPKRYCKYLSIYVKTIYVIDMLAKPTMILGICILSGLVIWCIKKNDVFHFRGYATENDADCVRERTRVLVVKTYNFLQSSHTNNNIDDGRHS